MRGSFKPHVQAKPHRVLSPGSCGHQAAERAADGGASSMSDDLPKRSGGCSGTISGVRAQRRRRSCRGNASQAGCGPPSCVRHLMFKFWELSAINCCGTHLCSRQPQLRFRRMQRQKARILGTPMEQSRSLILESALAKTACGNYHNAGTCSGRVRYYQRSVQRASACAHPGTRRRPSKIQP